MEKVEDVEVALGRLRLLHRAGRSTELGRRRRRAQADSGRRNKTYAVGGQ